MSTRADRGALAFAEQLLSLLGEGSFTATYKYAVILGLMDLCLEQSTRSGAAPTMVTTPQLAGKVLELYWPHTLPFHDESILRQNSGGQASVLTQIVAFRERHAPDVSATLHKARLAAPDQIRCLIRKIEWTLVEMPLPKLQRIGTEVHAFIYQIAWDDAVTRGEFNGPEFDNRINFVGAAGDYLVRLVGLIRPLVQREWANRVAQLNTDSVESCELEDFLFGADRVSLEPVRGELRDLQKGRCFYCNRRIRAEGEVDHFVPWSRYANNAIENLVLAHHRCNRAKLDHLVAVEHLERWVERASRRRADLEVIAKRRSWDSSPQKSCSVARSIYLRLPEDVRLWRMAQEFVPLDRERLMSVLVP